MPLSFPSLYEGFGLPVLEAMACGAPVIAADNSALPEVAGDAALLVPATDPRAIAVAIESVLSDDNRRSELIECGFARAARFSWTATAAQTLALLRGVRDNGKAAH
jgi:glycosyltransferase involved in cell wall biosynthesis